jgi:spore germination cell wall hydrolase CwlJ-like protein
MEKGDNNGAIPLKMMPLYVKTVDNRELFARLIRCEAGGEGLTGMRAVATCVMNRTRVTYGEYRR